MLKRFYPQLGWWFAPTCILVFGLSMVLVFVAVQIKTAKFNAQHPTQNISLTYGDTVFIRSGSKPTSKIQYTITVIK